MSLTSAVSCRRHSPGIARVQKRTDTSFAAAGCLESLGRTNLLRSLAALTALLLTPVAPAAQNVTEPALKAAFIHRFAGFTEWPDQDKASSEPRILCVLGDPSIGDALARVVKGRRLAGHRIDVTQASPAVPPRAGCHVLFVSGVTVTQAASLIEGVRDAPVLTISDVNGFTRVGGIVQLFFEDGQLRFTIHHEAAKRARLQLSSQLLKLSTTQTE